MDDLEREANRLLGHMGKTAGIHAEWYYAAKQRREISYEDISPALPVISDKIPCRELQSIGKQAKLTERQIACLSLRYLGYKVSEIATRVYPPCCKQTVRNEFSRAKSKMTAWAEGLVGYVGVLERAFRS